MKRIKGIPVGTPVAISWRDHASIRGWTPLKDSMDGLMCMQSVGFLVGTTPEAVVITHTFTEGGKTTNDPMSLGWDMVDELIVLPRRYNAEAMEKRALKNAKM